MTGDPSECVGSAQVPPPVGPATTDQHGGRNPAQRPPQSPWQLFAPIVVFLAVNRLAGLRWAVVIATICSVGTVIDRRRKGLSLGRLFPLITAALLIRGAIGAITGSEAVYFGLGIAAKYVAVAALLGSVLLGKPLAGLVAPHALAVSRQTQKHPAFQAAMRDVTLLGALYYLLSASFDLWLFQRSDIEGFVVIRLLANWPLGIAMLAAAFVVANARLKTIDGLEPLPELLEKRLGSYET